MKSDGKEWFFTDRVKRTNLFSERHERKQMKKQSGTRLLFMHNSPKDRARTFPAILSKRDKQFHRNEKRAMFLLLKP